MSAVCKALRLLRLPKHYRTVASSHPGPGSAPGSVVDQAITYVREKRSLGEHEQALDVLKSTLAAQGPNKTGVSAGRCVYAASCLKEHASSCNCDSTLHNHVLR